MLQGERLAHPFGGGDAQHVEPGLHGLVDQAFVVVLGPERHHGLGELVVRFHDLINRLLALLQAGQCRVAITAVVRGAGRRAQ